MGGGVDRPDEMVTRTSRRRIQGGIDGRPRCDPEPSGSAERGRGRRGYGAERPGKTSRAGCRVNMIRSYGRSVATNLNEPRFGESRAAPLQGADIGRPSRSELERVPNDDILPTDHSTMKSDRHGRDYRRPEQDEDPVLRQIHPKLNSYSLVQNNNGSNFLNLQLYLSAMISSQSVLLLVILASSSILTCHLQIKLTPCLSLVIFISETSVVFVISFLFLQLQRLANSLVSSKLDYCNSLYNGISQANLNKIQRIQNTLARVVTNTSKFEHITPVLKKLHWLPIKQRIDYKLCLLTL